MTASGVVTQALLAAIRAGYVLDWNGLHGAPHWERVKVNGLRLARATGARTDVVELFAYLHDACRVNDAVDDGHGRRAADLARRLRGVAFALDETGLELLATACERHTDGLAEGDPVVLTCWDADRLDLGRVGFVPDPARLGTAAARDPEVIAWAMERSRAAPRRR